MELIQQFATEIFILLFLSITFLLSGIDKVSDWNGNISFIEEHFKNSPLKGKVSFLLLIIMIIEIIAGAMMFVGIFYLATIGTKEIALIGIQLSAVCLLFLLIGQRLAKDYEGAMSLGVYFLITIFGMYLLNK